MFEYMEKMKGQMDRLEQVNSENLQATSKLIGDTLINDKIIHILGTGHSHMIGLELFIRAGGLANVNAILDSTVLTADGAIRSSKLERVSGIADILWEEQNIAKDDLVMVISNSGRNALPIEFAMRAKKEGHTVIALTSLEQSKQYPSRHSSGKKLYEIGDIVLDNCVPSGDGLLEIEGIQTGAPSTVSGITLLHTAVTEGMKIAAKHGVKLPVYTSQNIDGYSNSELYEKYSGRIKHM
ncbi:SIS domain-containing protein [Lentibacillus cibarius]|uniref:SIS domain-containing protein n=1 Tax=Lentibacillus cibarius TaxID=2583219 RepID=A0A549YEZ1_9BACI|nr:SIS domain-containing protein [Lentibacillus cibarius]TMN21551.1 SIS domain-containing protein [Lentibacillus cibarius]TRM10451.1 SIS domain-containing protein [Lentibacillus cibarius]